MAGGVELRLGSRFGFSFLVPPRIRLFLGISLVRSMRHLPMGRANLLHAKSANVTKDLGYRFRFTVEAIRDFFFRSFGRRKPESVVGRSDLIVPGFTMTTLMLCSGRQARKLLGATAAEWTVRANSEGETRMNSLASTS